MKFLRRIFSSEDSFDRRYDEKFGCPSTDVFRTDEFLQFLDEVIHFDDITSAQEATEDWNDLSKYLISKVVATEDFESALKQLKKKHQTNVIKNLRTVIVELLGHDISTRHSNHPLTNMLQHRDIHLDGGRLVLIYKYLTDSELIMSLKLQDVVEHKELKRYNKKKLVKPTHKFDMNKLKTTESDT